MMTVSQVPVLNEVRDITLGEKGDYALISYENMVGSFIRSIDWCY